MSAPPPYPGDEAKYPPPGGQPQGYGVPQQQYPPTGPAPYAAAPAGSYPQQQYPPPAQQPGYGQQQQSTVIVAQPVTTLVQQYRENPVQTTCPHCNSQIVTATHYETGTLTWVAAGITCLVGCWLGCCLIPFCIDGCKDVIHSCPNCNHTLYRWNRM